MLEKLLSSRYQIIKPIGQGGFGKTYLAKDLQLPGNPLCVVKQFHPAVSSPNFLDVARRLFNTEAQALQKLGNHKCIPQLLAHFEEEEEFYLVQQYIEGNTLSQELIPDQFWSEEDIIKFLQECLQTLDFIHNQGVIHRDIKPDNLIRRKHDQKIVLVDFGSVKEVINSQTQIIQSTVAVGTRGYMPTEQARGKPRITSDLYALGIIAIQAATGVHPIDLQEDENGEIIWQSQANISSKLVDILSKMVRYHFKDRYQSASEILKDLKSLTNDFLASSGNLDREYTPTTVIGQASIENSLTDNNLNVNDVVVTEATELKMNQDVTNSGSTESSILLNSNLDAEPVLPTLVSPSLLGKNQSPLPKNSQHNSFSKILAWFKSSTGKTLSIAVAIALIATAGQYLFKDMGEKAEKKEIENKIKELDDKYYDAKYQQCYEEAEKAEIQQTGIPEKTRIELIKKCRLKDAEEKARFEEFSEAIAIAIKIPEDTPQYQEDVMSKIDLWSNEILENAAEIYIKNGDIDKARQMIKSLPESTDVRKKAFKSADQWRQDKDTNETIIEKAQAALNKGNWEKAIDEAKKVRLCFQTIIDEKCSGTDYWQQRAKDIRDKATKAINDKKNQQPPPPITPPPKIERPTPTPQTIAPPPKIERPTPTPQPITPPPKQETKPQKKPLVIETCPGILCPE